jgi:hypothetical protein
MSQWIELAERFENGENIEPSEFSSDLAELFDDGLQAIFKVEEIKEFVDAGKDTKESQDNFFSGFISAIEQKADNYESKNDISSDDENLAVNETVDSIDVEEDKNETVISDDTFSNESAKNDSKNEYDAKSTDTDAKTSPSFNNDNSFKSDVDNKADTKESKSTKSTLNDREQKYLDAKEKYSHRDTFVAFERLSLDLEAYKTGQPGVDGNEVKGANIVRDFTSLWRSNIFETVIERALISVIEYFENKYADTANEKDSAVKEEAKESVREEAYVTDRYGIVRDDGYIKDASKFETAGVSVEAMKRSNPDYAQFKGADVSRAPMERDGMRIWDTGRYERQTVVSGGTADTINIPPVRLVELHDNFYHVDPFGKVLSVDDRNNASSALEVGGYFKSLDISARNEEKIETLAKNNGITVDELKEKITANVENKFADKIEGQLDAHKEYIVERAIPEAQTELEGRKAELETLGEQKDVLTSEYKDLQEKADSGSLSIDDDKRMSEIEDKLERNAEATDVTNEAIEKIETRIEQLEKTVETYNDAKVELSREDAPEHYRFSVAADTENVAVGRTEIVDYVDREADSKTADTVNEAKADIEAAHTEKTDDISVNEQSGIETPADDVQDNSLAVDERIDEKLDNRDILNESNDETIAEIKEDIEADVEKPIEEIESTANTKVVIDEGVDSETNTELANDPSEGIDTNEIIEDSNEGESADEDKNVIEGQDSEPFTKEDSNESTDGKGIVNTEEKSDDDFVAVQASEQQLDANQSGDSSQTATIESGQEEVKDAVKGEKGDKAEEGTDRYDELRSEIAEAFDKALDMDFYNLYLDFYPTLSDADMTVMSESHIMVDAFVDVLESRGFDTETTGISFGELLHEIASLHDGPEMSTIDNTLNEIYSRSENIELVESFAVNEKENLADAMLSEDLMFEVTGPESMSIQIGGEVYDIGAEGVTNAFTGLEQDPNDVVAKLHDFITNEHGSQLDWSVDINLEGLNINDTSEFISGLDNFYNSYPELIKQQVETSVENIQAPQDVNNNYMPDVNAQNDAVVDGSNGFMGDIDNGLDFSETLNGRIDAGTLIDDQMEIQNDAYVEYDEIEGAASYDDADLSDVDVEELISAIL